MSSLYHEPYRDSYYSRVELGNLSREFKENGFVALPGLLRRELFLDLRTSLASAQETFVRRNFIMDEFKSPRRMAVAGARALNESVPILNTIYFHLHTINLISQITASEIFFCGHEDEYAVVNFLQGTGDTHGWHLDDPDYALVMCFNAPSDPAGGVLEYSAFNGSTEHDDSSAYQSSINRYFLKSGDAYLLNAASNWHRVTPLVKRTDQRWAVNFAYQKLRRMSYGTSASELYAPNRAG